MDVAFNESLIFFLTLSYYEGTFKKKQKNEIQQTPWEINECVNINFILKKHLQKIQRRLKSNLNQNGTPTTFSR